MHLTSLGKIENSVTALTALIQNGQKGNLLLASSIKLLSTEEKIAVVSRLALTEQQKIGLLATAGLTAEELKNVVATGALKVAQDGATLSTFSLTAALQGLKTAVLTNPLLMATAVVAGLFAVYKAVDLLTVSFEEQKEIVNDLSNEVNDLQSEYDKLKADPSVNGSKLYALKRELEIKKDILEIEKETLALKDMQENMPDISNKTGTSGGHVNPTWTPEDTAETDIRGDLQKLYQARNNMSNIDSIIPVAQDMVMQGYVQQEADALKELSGHTNTLKTEYLEIAEAKAKLEQYVEDGTLKGVNADIARQKIAEYQAEIDRLDPIILEAELELGTASYLEAYNQLWDKIENDDSHRRSLDFDYVDIYVPTEELDNIVVKTKELNQEFLDGKQNATEYFDSISKLITDSGLEEGLSNLKGNDNDATDYLEQVVSGLSTQVSDSMMESAGRFIRGESSVQEYTDELESAAEAEMKLLKAFHKFETDANGQVKNFEDLDEAGKNAADTYNELENKLDDLREVDAMIEVNTNYADLISDYENWTEDMLDTEPIQNYVKEMSAAIAQYAKDNKDSIDTIVTDLTKATGVAIEKEKLLSTNAASYLQDVCGNSIVAVHGMVVYSTGETTKVVTNASQALGGVLEALGNMIENFEYTITATPKVVVDPKIEMDDNGVPHLQLGSYELKFSGKGGQSVKDFSTALKGAASYFENNDVFGERLNDVDSYKSNGMSGGNNVNNDTTIKNPTGSGGSSSSTKDPHIAEVDKYKSLTDAVEEYDRKLEKLERTYDNTDSIEERIGLKQAEIKLYQEQKDAIDALNKARDAEISDLVNKLRGQGFKIDYDPTTDNLLIHNREHINDLNQSIIEQYEEYIKRADELNDANKDSADQWDELTSSIVKAGKELKDLEQEKFEDYIEGAEHLLRLMENRKDAFGKESSVYTDMMNATLKRWKELATTDYQGNIDQIRELEEQWMDFYDARIEKEKEILEMQLDDNDRVLDGVIKVIDDQIKALDDQIDGLSKANDERKKALELQKAQAELDKARNQKTRHVLRKDVGWVWESDEDAIKEAKENLSDLEYESKTDALEKEKEALEDLKEKWEEIPNIAEDEQNRLLMIEKLGANAEKAILEDRTDVYEKFKDDYIDIQEQIQDKTDELEEHTSKAYLNVVKAFENMAKLAGIGLDVETPTSQTTQTSWYVQENGKAPSQAQIGDTILTKGGTYRITGKDENGKFISEKIDDISHDIKDGMWGTEVQNVSNTIKSIYDELKDLQKGGTVDLLNRPEVSSKIMQQAGWDTEDGSISTVNTSTYSNRDGSVAMNFTPIQVDKNGKLVRVLSESELQRYAEAVIDGVHDDYLGLKIGKTFTGKNAIANAELDAQRIHELHETLTTDETGVNFNDSLALNTISTENLIDRSEEVNERIKANILSNDELRDYMKKNTDVTWEDVDAILDNIDFTQDNSSAIGDNTSELRNLIYTLGNLESDKIKEEEIGIEESLKEALSNFDDSTMSPEDQAYVKELQKAWITAKEQGNTELMDELHALADAIREQYINGTLRPLVDGKDYNRIGSDGYSTVFHENSRSDAYGGAAVAGIIGTTKSIWGLDASNQEQVDSLVKSGLITEEESKKLVQVSGRNVDEVSKNTSGLKESTNSNIQLSDDVVELGDTMVDVGDTVSESSKESAEIISGALSKISTVGSGSGGGRGSDPFGGGNSYTDGDYTHTKGSDGLVHVTDKTGKEVGKYATGGTDIPAGLANVDEEGAELSIQPQEGRWIKFEYDGNAVFNTNSTNNLLKFSENPKMFLSDVLGYDAMKMNQQIVYTGSGEKVIQYHIGSINPTLPNVTKPAEFWDEFTRNLPNEAEQWATTGY